MKNRFRHTESESLDGVEHRDRQSCDKLIGKAMSRISKFTTQNWKMKGLPLFGSKGARDSSENELGVDEMTFFSSQLTGCLNWRNVTNEEFVWQKTGLSFNRKVSSDQLRNLVYLVDHLVDELATLGKRRALLDRREDGVSIPPGFDVIKLFVFVTDDGAYWPSRILQAYLTNIVLTR